MNQKDPSTDERHETTSDVAAPSTASFEESSSSGISRSPEEKSNLFQETLSYLSLYVSAQIDEAKLTARELLLKIVFGILALFILGAALITAVVFLLYGVAAGLGNVLGIEPFWGYLFTGLFFLLAIGLAGKLTLVVIRRKSLKRKVHAYEKELETQRAQFGHDALERASAE